MRLDKLSGGQQQKVQLGVTIMNDPELLILDEPTKGFDPVNRRLLMDIIDDQKTRRRDRHDGHPPDGGSRAPLRPGHPAQGRHRPAPTAPSPRSRSSSAAPSPLDYDGVLPASALYDIVSAGGGQAELSPPPGPDETAVLRELIGAGVAVTVLHHRQDVPGGDLHQGLRRNPRNGGG